MSRLSRANLKARESIFAGGPEQYIGDIQARCPPDLEECVMAMEDCCEEVYLPVPHAGKYSRFSRHMKLRFSFVMVPEIYLA